jgi:hypothetical protein
MKALLSLDKGSFKTLLRLYEVIPRVAIASITVASFCDIRRTYIYIAYVSIRQHTSAYVSIRRFHHRCLFLLYQTNLYIYITIYIYIYIYIYIHIYIYLEYVSIRQHTSAHVSTRQHTSAHVSTRQHTSAHVSIRQHTSAHVSISQHRAVRGLLLLSDEPKKEKEKMSQNVKALSRLYLLSMLPHSAISDEPLKNGGEICISKTYIKQFITLSHTLGFSRGFPTRFHSSPILRFYKALLRLCQGSFQAVLRLS